MEEDNKIFLTVISVVYAVVFLIIIVCGVHLTYNRVFQDKSAQSAAEYIPVFAMAAEDFPLLEEAKAQAGDEPDAWIPVYQALRRARSNAAKAAAPVTNYQPTMEVTTV